MKDMDDDECSFCKQKVWGAHKCIQCGKSVHLICGKAVGDERYGQQVTCFKCTEGIES